MNRSQWIRRVLCALGVHRWKADRYWSLGGLYVEENVCAGCLRAQERKVLYRP